MKSLLQTLMIFSITCSMSVSAFAAPIGNSAEWATGGITKAYEAGIVSPYLTGKASDNISRKDLSLLAVQLFTKITGSTAVPKAATPFSDVDLPAITFAYEQGIVSGKTATDFYPEQTISKEHLAIIISRTLIAANIPLNDNSTSPPFVDISTLSDGSQGAIQQLYSNKIINGFEGYYYPQQAVTKQEAILAFLNAYDYSNTALVKLADSTITPASEAPAPNTSVPETIETSEPAIANISSLAGENDQLDSDIEKNLSETADQASNESSITIGNKALSIGQTAREVWQISGTPDRIDQDSFGYERYVYLNGNADLFFVSINDNQQVVEIYTGSDNFEYMGLKGSDSRKDITKIKFDDKKRLRVELPAESLDAYVLLDHEDGIEGILLRDKSIRNLVDRRYNQTFENGIILELVDLMNQARARQGQPVLTWDLTASNIAAKHSFNMSKNSFVEYNDTSGKTPFDRMTEGGLQYTIAAEIAGKYEGDAISVYHEWMRNIGTRSNVLNSSLSHGGVGVFMDNYSIYITADLFTP